MLFSTYINLEHKPLVSVMNAAIHIALDDSARNTLCLSQKDARKLRDLLDEALKMVEPAP